MFQNFDHRGGGTAAGVYGVAWYMQHLFSYGTRINTVNASFLTVEEVKERLLEGLSGYTLTIQAKDGEEAGDLRGGDRPDL